MTLFTIGFTKKTAEQFFETLKHYGIDIVVDIRLNNKSQLAGFTKGEDLRYFLQEICHCEYVHDIALAPTKEILDDYKKNIITWTEYEERFAALMNQPARLQQIKRFERRFAEYENVCLLCSEPTPEQCHRRLIAEMIESSSAHPIAVRHI